MKKFRLKRYLATVIYLDKKGNAKVLVFAVAFLLKNQRKNWARACCELFLNFTILIFYHFWSKVRGIAKKCFSSMSLA